MVNTADIYKVELERLFTYSYCNIGNKPKFKYIRKIYINTNENFKKVFVFVISDKTINNNKSFLKWNKLVLVRIFGILSLESNKGDDPDKFFISKIANKVVCQRLIYNRDDCTNKVKFFFLSNFILRFSSFFFTSFLLLFSLLSLLL